MFFLLVALGLSQCAQQKPKVIRSAFKDVKRNAKKKEDRCVAPKPEEGVLHTESSQYSRVKIRKGQWTIVETAQYAKEPIELEVTSEGCENRSILYRFRTQDPHSIEDNEYYLKKTVELLDDVKLKRGSSDNNYVKQIKKAVEKHKGDPQSLKSCWFTLQSGYDHAHCRFKRERETVILEIGYTIAL